MGCRLDCTPQINDQPSRARALTARDQTNHTRQEFRLTCPGAKTAGRLPSSVSLPRTANSMRRGGHSYPALGKLGDLAYPGLVLFVVFVMLICGGGTRQGLWSDALAQIVSLPLLAVAAFRLKGLPSSQLR